MPIKNYTTTIKPDKSVAEIQKILAKAGGKIINVEYFQGEPEAVRFSVSLKDKTLWFRLPGNPHGVLSAMKQDKVQKSKCTLEHARAVSWRIIKDWIDAQMAIIEANQATLTEVFLPYLLDNKERTLYENFVENEMKLLPESLGK